jgi:hypothetical protein
MSSISRRTAAASTQAPGEPAGAAGFPVSADNVIASTERTVGTAVRGAATAAAVATGTATVDPCGTATTAEVAATAVATAGADRATCEFGCATVESEPIDPVEEEPAMAVITEAAGWLAFAGRRELPVECLPGATVADDVAPDDAWSALEPIGLLVRSVAVADAVSLALARRALAAVEPNPAAAEASLAAAGDEPAPLADPWSAWATPAPLAKATPTPSMTAPATSQRCGSRPRPSAR